MEYKISLPNGKILPIKIPILLCLNTTVLHICRFRYFLENICQIIIKISIFFILHSLTTVGINVMEGSNTTLELCPVFVLCAYCLLVNNMGIQQVERYLDNTYSR